jgi:hypothetical protein
MQLGGVSFHHHGELRMADAAKLADMLARDMLREKPVPSRADVTTCHACGRAMTYHGPNGDVSGRFCSDNCRELYDAGSFSAHDPTYHHKNNQRWYRLPIGPQGFLSSASAAARPSTATDCGAARPSVRAPIVLAVRWSS